MNLQNASKEELMSIAGIGAKKAMLIMEYRKTHKINSVSDLLKIKGIGSGIVSNVKNDVKNKSKSKSKSKSSSGYTKKAKKQYSDKKDKAMKKFDTNKKSAQSKMNKMKNMF
jgi:competence protein ComEA